MTNGTVVNDRVSDAAVKAAIKKNEELFLKFGEKQNFLDNNFDEFYIAMNWKQQKLGKDFVPDFTGTGMIFISRGQLTRGRVKPVVMLNILKWCGQKDRKEILETWHIIDKYAEEQKYNV